MSEIIDFESLRAEYLACKERIKEIEIELKQIEPGTYEAGEGTITVSKPPARFDTAGFEREHPAEEYPNLYITVEKLDTKQVSDEDKAVYVKYGAPSLTIK